MSIALRHLTALALCASSVLVVACNRGATDGNLDSESQALATDGNEAVASNAQQTSFGESIFALQTKDASGAALELSGKANTSWPAGCATHTRDASNPRVVHIHFTDCTGPFGLRHLSGDETATFSQNADGSLHVQLEDDGDLTVNGKAVKHSASGDVVDNNGQRAVAWKGAWDRTTDKGITVSHTTDLTITFDRATLCRDTNGTAVTLVGSREIDTKIEDVKLCVTATGAGCPSGTVVHTGKASGKSVTVEFDGSAEAKVTGPRGNSAEVALVCTP